MAIAVPTYGSPVAGGIATFNPNTGAPLAGAGAFNPNTGKAINYGTSATPTAPVASPYPMKQPTTTQSPIKSPYAVVTAQPAQQNLQNISDFYNNTNTAVTTQAQNNQQANTASAQIPTIPGYNVSGTTATKNPGEISVTQNGQTYYATPTTPPMPSSEDVWNAVNGGTTGTAGANTTGGAGITTPVAQNIEMQPLTNPTGIDINQENANYTNALATQANTIEGAYNTFNQAVKSMMSGTFPLSGAQQSLVNATSNAFDSLMSNAQLKANALSSETGGVSNKINGMMGDFANIQSTKAGALANMEIGFQNQDFNMLTKSYDAFTQAENTQTSLVTDMHNTVITAYQNAVDNSVKQQTLQLQQQQFAETIIKDNETLAQSKYDFQPAYDAFGQRIGTQVYDKTTGQILHTNYTASAGVGSDPTTGSLSPVTMDSTGKPDTTQQQQFLSTIPSAYRDLVSALVNYQSAPPSSRTAKGAQILAWAHSLDPSYDETQYAARASYQKNLQSGTLSQAIVSANKASAHLVSLSNSLASLPNVNFAGGILPINKDIQFYTKLFNIGGQSANLQTNISQAQIESTGVTDELAKFFKGTGATDVNSIEQWGKNFSTNMTPANQKGAIQGAVTLMVGQLDAVKSQYQSVMGRTPAPGQILQPQAVAQLSTLRNQGYDFGDMNSFIPYSDPIAFAQSSPDNATALSDIRSEFPELTPAQALQLAQSQ